MKNIFVLLFGILFIVSACHKDPPEATLPDDVNLGESVVYLNGELVSNYKPEFKYIEVYKTMNYGFYDSVGQVTNIFGFDGLPLDVDNFNLHTERILFVKALTSFNQVISGDLEGYSYKLIDADEGFLNVEYLDTVKQEVKGRFKAKFSRTSKNGNKD